MTDRELLTEALAIIDEGGALTIAGLAKRLHYSRTAVQGQVGSLERLENLVVREILDQAGKALEGSVSLSEWAAMHPGRRRYVIYGMLSD